MTDIEIVRATCERLGKGNVYLYDQDAAAIARLVLAMLKEIDWMEVRSANRVEISIAACARELQGARR